MNTLYRRSLVASATSLLLATLFGCSRPAPEKEQSTPEKPAAAAPAAAPIPAARQRVIVFAASSLTDAFNALEQSFEAENSDVDVAPSYGGSQALKLQIIEGAPSDVFASADEVHMQELVKAGSAEPSQTFAWNELVLIVPEDNPAHITELKDLTLARRFVIGAANVPAGNYTRQLLESASKTLGPNFGKDVLSHVVSEESNVRLVRAKVELGEADAAIVYKTDAASSKKVKQIPIAPELNVKASYPIAVLTKAPAPSLARRWVAYVLSAPGRAALAAHGFLVKK